MSLAAKALVGSVALSVIAATGSASDGLAVTPLEVADSQGVRGQPTTPTADFVTELISVKADGTFPRKPSWGATVSGNGRYVVFLSRAKDLDAAAGSPHNRPHVYLRDLQTDVTTAVDVRPDGRFGSGSASDYSSALYRPAVSADGRFVAFASDSRELAPGGGRDNYDVFMRDMVAGTTALVSQRSDGGPARGDCNDLDLSADGSTIVFSTKSRNIIPGLAKGRAQLYHRDLATGAIRLISKSSSGDIADEVSQLPSLSGDGNLVAYQTLAENIVAGGDPDGHDVVLYDVVADASVLVSRPKSGEVPDGSSWVSDIDVLGTTVAYLSDAENLTRDDENHERDIFAYDVATRTQTLISRTNTGGQTDGTSGHASVSAGGDFFAYSSKAKNIVPPDDSYFYDIFSYDAGSDETAARSRNRQGGAASEDSEYPSISDDGALVVFQSEANDLVRGVRGYTSHIYVSRES